MAHARAGNEPRQRVSIFFAATPSGSREANLHGRLQVHRDAASRDVRSSGKCRKVLTAER